MTDLEKIFEVYLHEYNKLKDEQSKRISFRDNILYVTLGVFGGIISLALSSQNYYALLIIPWICLILGWTYLVNDEKISAIGKYIRYTLVSKISQLTGNTDIDNIFGWEIVHRTDKHRKRRKIEQLIIDQIAFVVSGILALIAFWFLVSQPPLAVNILSAVELIFLIILAVEIFIYADLDA